MVGNRVMKRILMVLILLAGAGGTAAVFFSSGDDRSSKSFRLTPVTREDLQMAISATGTVEPEELVDVGAQVAGKIVSFGKDNSGKIVHYGSAVEEGNILARIDDALYAADVEQAEAQLGQSLAGLKRAEADLLQLQAKLRQAERDWARARKLGPSEALAQSAYDAARSAFETAEANVAVGKASIEQARNTVALSRASLKRSRQNLAYCTIKSPVKGVIIDRRVEIGQTVVASLNAPSLFLIAKDLRRMQVWVAVNEADIGSIHPGQPVVFTVDTFPDHVFQGQVGKVRLNATMTQNVVTFTVEVNTDNIDGKLMPYLTAHVKFIVDERRNVLTVPNGALRWTPHADRISGEKPGDREADRPRPEGRREGRQNTSPRTEERIGTLWTPDGDKVRSMAVRMGLSDGMRTEVEGEGLKEGMLIAMGEQQMDAPKPSETVNPFTPQLPGRGVRR